MRESMLADPLYRFFHEREVTSGEWGRAGGDFTASARGKTRT